MWSQGMIWSKDGRGLRAGRAGDGRNVSAVERRRSVAARARSAIAFAEDERALASGGARPNYAVPLLMEFRHDRNDQQAEQCLAEASMLVWAIWRVVGAKPLGWDLRS